RDVLVVSVDEKRRPSVPPPDPPRKPAAAGRVRSDSKRVDAAAMKALEKEADALFARLEKGDTEALEGVKTLLEKPGGRDAVEPLVEALTKKKGDWNAIYRALKLEIAIARGNEHLR